MLYPTLNQPLILLVMFACGMFAGLIFDVARLLTTLSGNDKISKHIFDFIATILAFLFLFFANLWFNYGQFRVYVLAIFLLSFSLERFISKILWTKLLSKWYSNITRKKVGRKKKKTSS